MWKHYLIYSVRLIEIISLLLAPLLIIHPFTATISRYSCGGGADYQFVGVEYAHLTIGSNTEYYAIGLSYNGTNATLWFELYNSTEYPNVENWTWFYELGFSGNQAYNYTAVCEEANAILNYWDNMFYEYGYFDLGFPLVFYVNQTTNQLIMWVPNVTDPGVIAIYTYNTGNTVYVFGWLLKYTNEGEYVVMADENRIFEYEVQFSNDYDALHFQLDLMNFFYTYKVQIQKGEMTYQDLYNLLGQDTDSDPVVQYANSYNGYLAQVFRASFDPTGYTLDELAEDISNELAQNNEDWGATVPTNVVVYDGGIIYPPDFVESTPGLTGIWIIDQNL